jgi:hypothetical protein
MGTIGVALLLVSGCTAATRLTPLPFDARVQQPAATVPPDVARFAGVWSGYWEGGVDHTLVVENIAREGNTYRVSAVYSWGAYEASRLRPGFQRVAGTIDGQVLRLDRFGNGAQPTYRLQGDLLHGSYWPMAQPGYETTAVLRRATVSSASALPSTVVAIPSVESDTRATASEHSAIAAPVPPDVRIRPPDVTVSPRAAAFSGKWRGRWDGGRDHVLVVESIEPSAGAWKAMVVYSWGPGPGNGSPGGFQRLAGRITEDGVLHVPLGQSTAMYRPLARSEGLEGQWVPQAGSALFGLFHRDGAQSPRRQ